jgi:hypothetical protein
MAPPSGAARGKASARARRKARKKARARAGKKGRRKARGKVCEKAGREEAAVWSDLAALTPPLVVCVAFLIGIALLLRSQLSPKRRAERDERRRSPDQRS